MKILDLSMFDNLSSKDLTAEQLKMSLAESGTYLRDLVVSSTNEGNSFDQVERAVFQALKKIGFGAMELLIRLQGTGDLGIKISSAEGSLTRNSKQSKTRIRSIFGEHSFQECTYGAGINKKIDLRPISARLDLPEHQWSFLLQEFSQLFCVEQAFNQASRNLETVLGGRFSVDTLEHTSQRMGVEADNFLDALPVPAKADEAKLLVATADGKGVPLIKQDCPPVAAFEQAKKRPGNRRMATVASVYTVDPYIRTPEQIVEALFRDERENQSERPKPKNKHTTAHFATNHEDGEKDISISAILEGTSWLAQQIRARKVPKQKLILLMDGQEALWDAANVCLEGTNAIEILDIIHVSSYVWDAANLFETAQDKRMAFTRKRLLAILSGRISSVLKSLRRLGTIKGLRGEKLTSLNKICGYFEKHKSRMQYDEYLRTGYPIATGVIEGACRHLVKDRMERSGMRWTLEGARSMLNVRAVFQSAYWEAFCKQRISNQSTSTHPNRHLINDYQPLSQAC
jgi:hypothetical protein